MTLLPLGSVEIVLNRFVAKGTAMMFQGKCHADSFETVQAILDEWNETDIAKAMAKRERKRRGEPG